MTSHSVYILGKEEGRGNLQEGWLLSSQEAIMYDRAQLSWRWLNTYLLIGSSDGFLVLLCLRMWLLLYLLSCLYLNPQIFSVLLF